MNPIRDEDTHSPRPSVPAQTHTRCVSVACVQYDGLTDRAVNHGSLLRWRVGAVSAPSAAVVDSGLSDA